MIAMPLPPVFGSFSARCAVLPSGQVNRKALMASRQSPMPRCPFGL
jgi:hypothetical protein